jgi:hypothetical protein
MRDKIGTVGWKIKRNSKTRRINVMWQNSKIKEHSNPAK